MSYWEGKTKVEVQKDLDLETIDVYLDLITDRYESLINDYCSYACFEKTIKKYLLESYELGHKNK